MANYIPNVEFIIEKVAWRDGQYVLDIEKATDFPLALTYSIKDVQDPSSSKGSFSKTFSIPATGHNNEILKGLYSDSLFDHFIYIEDYEALIYVDGMLVLQGKFQVKGTKYRGIPKSYECQVFGENYKWVNALSELNLCDIDFKAGNFFPHAPDTATFGHDAIQDTWEFGLAGEILMQGSPAVQTQTHIVYPLVNMGRWNFDTGGLGVVTPSDMSPAFYFYNMLKCIFAKQGYQLQSEFMETNYFKRLISFLPKEKFENNEVIVEQYAFEMENNSATPWKVPLNYANTTGGVGDCAGSLNNDWHGQSYGLQEVCPTCNPSNQVTDQDITPHFNISSPINLTSNYPTGWSDWAGTVYGAFGSANGSDIHCPWLVNTCPPQYKMGTKWSCVECDPWVSGNNKPVSMDDTSMFQTTYLGTYTFEWSVEVEMNNEYEMTNPVAPYDQTYAYKGTMYGGAATAAVIGTPLAAGSRRNGVEYNFVTYLCHYKGATGRTHLVAQDGKSLRNPNNPTYFNYYNADYPMQGGDPNLKHTMGGSGIVLDILHPDDRVFYYSECIASMWQRNYQSATTFSNTQVAKCAMKYRYRKQRFSGFIDETLTAGGSVDLSLILPCDTTQLDWVNGLTGLFNLFWQSDELTKTITVEPRDMFFDTIPNAIDWTDKLHHGKDQKNKFLYNALSRDLCFTYQNDSADGFVEERNRRRGQVCELGTFAMDLGELYENKEQRIGSDYYSPTYMMYDKTVSNNQSSLKQPFVPVISSDYRAIWMLVNNVAQAEKILDFAPRILLWYGLQPISQEDGLTSANTWRWGYDDLTTPHSDLQSYPFGGVYCDQVENLENTQLTIDSIDFKSPSLYFDNSEINAGANPAPFKITSGLYDMFWQRNILTLLDRPILKRAYFKLTPKDIASLDFRKLIYLEGSHTDTYWIVNKISDYKVGANALTLVELYIYRNTLPIKALIPDYNKPSGFGGNLTPQWTDKFVTSPLVENGASLVPKTNMLPMNLTPSILDTSTISLTPLSRSTHIDSSSALIKTNNYTSSGQPAPSQMKQSGNIGDNQNVGVGGISIGNNIETPMAGAVVIGNTNNAESRNPIQLTTHMGTALAISPSGLMLEGGGGVVYFEDTTTNEIKEVMTGIPELQTNGTTTFLFTRCVINEI